MVYSKPNWQVSCLISFTTQELKARNISLETVRICYSPFSRTSHTAKIVADVLGIPFASIQCKAMTELRERFFGAKFELLSHDKYTEIWALDEKDPFTSPEGGESVEGVVSRLGIALAALEAEYEGCSILLVSHGDPLQILQAVLGAAKENSLEGDVSSRIKQVTNRSVLFQHRKFALVTAELRRIE
ncbi:hypothetical protein HPP92_025534 [Vanilla planifolia]|uniref:Uncharacterized protein n=1 Tax=Vanilla planifolia TaxID=51239 RepID=A0A835PFJ9_VANPL|nr:hypothetical protein HPP92_025534 [Vanilla planifolia]